MTPSNPPPQTIPHLDSRTFTEGSKQDQMSFCRTLGEAFEKYGFLSLSHVGITDPQLRQCYTHCQDFFHKPVPFKKLYTPQKAKGQLGYVRFGMEKAKDAKTYDLKEFWHVNRASATCHSSCIHHSDIMTNEVIWPDGHDGFRDSLSQLYIDFEHISTVLLKATARYCDLAEDTFVQMCHQGPTVLRAAYYPQCDPHLHPGSIRAHAHEDINFITLLCASTAQGLEIKPPHEEWITVTITDPCSIIVSVGDMLQHLSCGMFHSTTHRVVNHNHCRDERLSLPYFVHPTADTDLTPLEICAQKTHKQDLYPPITAGSYLNQRLKEIGLDGDSSYPS